ncbi:N-acetyltransferase GCN5 [Aeromonas diversa CDC 2478-85]|uniref:N-acetyltransferase GCN5 n=1 Tax=Aeromonas diversa CDC 2478-85 TaxID=1268237 RepID=N9VKU5_9GAMM|nr:GNAT family N-acetyltransferase [Aeromonas diversa]ENY72203.1 N-acetyltransferase GCN5 [Aeromonas diversa CDC 2478-85]
MKLELLADNLNALDTVAKWYFDEWISAIPGVTIDRVKNKLSKSVNRESAPLLVIAKKDNELLGAAELKIREMDIYPEYEFWLGGVYVDEGSRGNGIGRALTENIIQRAKKIGIKKLYLQTEALSGGLYSSCGFMPIEQVEYKGHNVLVMVAELDT